MYLNLPKATNKVVNKEDVVIVPPEKRSIKEVKSDRFIDDRRCTGIWEYGTYIGQYKHMAFWHICDSWRVPGAIREYSERASSSYSIYFSPFSHGQIKIAFGLAPSG